MVRKHSAWARSRMSRSRPKTPAPTAGWVISDLSELSGMPVRRLRDYIARGLIRPLERRGTATRYDRAQLVRLMAIKRWRAELLTLGEIERRMVAMGERELEVWIQTAPLPEPVVRALGFGSAARESGTGPDVSLLASGAGHSPAPTERDSDVTGYRTFFHLELLPGLTLLLSASASPAVKQIAKRIHDEYVGG